MSHDRSLMLACAAVIALSSTTCLTDGTASADRKVPFGADPIPTRQSRRVDTGSDAHKGPASYALDFNWGGGDDDCYMDVTAIEVGHVERSGCKGKLYDLGYGCHVEIEHANGNRSFYAHLQPEDKIPNDVDACMGERIGKVGKTKNQKTCHLHFHMTNGNNNFLNRTQGVSFSNMRSRKLEAGGWASCAGHSYSEYNTDQSQWLSCSSELECDWPVDPN